MPQQVSKRWLQASAAERLVIMDTPATVNVDGQPHSVIHGMQLPAQQDSRRWCMH